VSSFEGQSRLDLRRARALASIVAFTSSLICLSGAALSAYSSEPPGGKNAQVVREIADPFTERQWVLARDEQHPGGPGRLYQVQNHLAARHSLSALCLAIRAGDRVLVDDRLTHGEAEFDGVAMDRAAAGAEFRVRLKLNEKIVRVVALGPGHATMAQEAGVGR